MVIGLIGMPGAGKGECARTAAEAGILVVNMGDLVREQTERSGLDMVDGNIGKVAHTEREKHGYGIWAARTVERIKGMDLNDAELIVIDGIRGDAEVEIFREEFGENLKTVAVVMPEEDRFRLLQERNRSDAPMTKEEFDRRETRELQWGLKRALDGADHVIMNTGTIVELKRSFLELLDRIKTELREP